MRGWLWLLVVLALGGLFWWGMQRNPKELPSVLAKERRPAPDFTLPLLPPYRAEWGEAFRLADHLGKRPIVLNFWAINLRASSSLSWVFTPTKRTSSRWRRQEASKMGASS